MVAVCGHPNSTEVHNAVILTGAGSDIWFIVLRGTKETYNQGRGEQKRRGDGKTYGGGMVNVFNKQDKCSYLSIFWDGFETFFFKIFPLS